MGKMLYENIRLRRIVLPLMKRLNFDFSIGHHWLPGRRVHLSFFQHKGYWYHGKARERETMEAFARLVPRGGTVIEVGGHIGYITAWFASLVGPSGRVVVFEPGPNNRKYLLRNLSGLANVDWTDRAASDEAGTVPFYCDNLTGQNNSLVRDFEGLEANAGRAGIAAERIEVEVEAVTLDDYCREREIVPDFVKIDVEGAELRVLRGMKSLLKGARPRLMVEKNGEDPTLDRELAAAGYVFLTPELRSDPEGRMRLGNNFCLHSGDPLLAALGAT